MSETRKSAEHSQYRNCVNRTPRLHFLSSDLNRLPMRA